MTEDGFEFVPLTDQDRADIDEAVETLRRRFGDVRSLAPVETVGRICEAHGFEPWGAGTGIDKDGKTYLRAKRAK